MSTQPAGQQSGSNVPSPSSAAPDTLNPLSMLADLESRISGLKKMHEQSAARETILSERELELVAKEREQIAKAEQVAAKERDLAALGEQLKRQQDEIRHQQARIEQTLSELSQQRQAAQGERERADREAQAKREQLHREAEQRDRQEADKLAAKERTLYEAERAISDREASLASREAALASRDAELAARDASIRERDRALKDLAERIEGVEAELDRRDAQAGESEKKLSEKEKWLVELESSIERRKREVDETHAAAAALEKELTERDARLNDREQDVESREKEAAQIAVRQQALAALEAQVEQRQSELREQLTRLEREKAEITERERALAATAISEQTSAIYAGRAEELQLKLGEASSARAALQSEVEHLREELKETRKKLETLSERPTAGDVEEVRRSAQQFKQQLEQSETQRGELATKIKQLEATVQELGVKAKHAAAADSLSEENDKLKRELGSRDEAIVQRDRTIQEIKAKATTLEREAAEARAAAATAVAAAGANSTSSGISPEEIEKRDQAIMLLKQRVDKVTEQNAALNAKAQQAEVKCAELEAALAQGTHATEPASSNAPSHDVERATRRQERLKQYKRLLQTQARKIVAAQAALQKRHADCEQILSQRAKIAAMSENIVRREKRLANSKARNGTVAALAYVVATLGLVGGLSWEVSKRIWPGVYVSKAVVEMDVRDRTVEPGQAVEWQKDMEQLVSDPRLMEVVSERMKRRGFDSLGSAAEIRDLVSKSMYTQSAQAGKLEFELRAEGQERSQLLLDTFVTAFKSVADESKGERAHDLGVNITSPAAASNSPLWDQRLQQAGMVFGGGVLLTGLLGAFVFSRLAAGKREFDQKTMSDSSFGEVDWATLEATFKKSAAPTDKKAA